MKDNHGFSLVEMIIVIAILAIVTTFGVMGINYLFGTHARACANELTTAIGRTRITTMGEQETILRIYQDAVDHAYYKQVLIDGATAEPPEQIGKSTIEMQYYIDGDSTAYVIDGSTELIIAFDRSSGAEIDTVTMNIGGITYASVKCNRIDVSSGSRTYTINIVPVTGKIFM